MILFYFQINRFLLTSLPLPPSFLKSLVVANGGLGNGVSRKQLLLALENCGPMEALLMPPNKPYAFVIYKAIEESKKAYANLNGKEIIDDLGQKIILYSNYVEKGTLKLLTFFV